MSDGRESNRLTGLNRRAFLGGTGSATLTTLAGCLGVGTNDDDDDGHEDDRDADDRDDTARADNQSDVPTVEFLFEHDGEASVTVTHSGEDGVDTNRLSLDGDLTGDLPLTGTLRAGDEFTLEVQPGERFELVWEDGERVLASFEMPNDVFDELESATPGYPEYGRWLVGTNDDESVFHIDFEREQAIEAYQLADWNPQERDVPFPDLGTIAEALPANNAIMPLAVMNSLALFFPFIGNFEFMGQEGSEPEEDRSMIVKDVTGLDGTNVVIFEGEVNEESIVSDETVTELDSHAGHTIYEAETDVSRRPFAMNGRTIILPFGGGEDANYRPQLESILAIGAEGIHVDPDLEWVLEHCGTGAFVFSGGAITGDAPDAQDAPLGIDEELFVEFGEILTAITTGMMVVDEHEEGRVSRTAFAFRRQVDVPDSERFASIIAPGATETNSAVTGNRIIVEAFWR